MFDLQIPSDLPDEIEGALTVLLDEQTFDDPDEKALAGGAVAAAATLVTHIAPNADAQLYVAITGELRASAAVRWLNISITELDPGTDASNVPEVAEGAASPWPRPVPVPSEYQFPPPLDPDAVAKELLDLLNKQT